MDTLMREIINPLINFLNGGDDERQIVLSSTAVLGVSPTYGALVIVAISFVIAAAGSLLYYSMQTMADLTVGSYQSRPNNYSGRLLLLSDTMNTQPGDRVDSSTFYKYMESLWKKYG